MYTVECDGFLIHDQKSPDKDIHLVSPKLNLQENSAGSFEFLIPPDNPGYSVIEKIISVIAVKKDGNVIWTGRPISEQIGFNGGKTVKCEGALAYLNDTLQDPQEYLNKNVQYIFRAIIEAHNAKVDSKRQFSLGSITIRDLDDSYIYETNYESSWETIKNQFIDRLEGHVSIHYNGASTVPYIDYTETYNTVNQEINFGENLLEFTKDYDLANLFTVIFPKGKEITQDTKNSDASTDRDPVTSNKTATINSVTVQYQVITSYLRVTVKITSISVTTSVKYSGEYNFKIVIGKDEIVSKDATYTSRTVNGKPVKTYQEAKACADAAIADVNTKISQDKAKVTYMRAQEAVTESMVINIFGKSTTIKINIPASDDSYEYITGKEKREYTTIASVNNGSVYLENTQAIATYGRIERTIEFNDVDDPTTLLNLGRRYLESTQFDEMSLSVSAVDLHFLDDSIQSFGFLDQVRCISHVHGMNKMFPITEVDLPLDAPDQVTYTMGHSGSTSMTAKTVAMNSSFYSALDNIPSFKNTLDSAKNDMSAILNRRTNGYVNLVQENDISQALVISDTPDWLNATKLWKWDINGLGYSDSTVEDVNYDGPSAIADGRWYKMGITMDGTIVANIIKTGILEDGVGYNYWNLSTGEFSLQPNSVMIGDDYSIEDLQEDVSNAVDAAADAQSTATDAQNTATIARASSETATATANTALSTANTADTKATAAAGTANEASATVNNMKVSFDLVEGKEYGVVNLINGTYAPEIKEESEGGGKWGSSNWKSCSGGNGQRVVLDCNKDTLGVNPPNSWLQKCVQIQGSTNGKAADIAQEEVPLESGSTYVMSCYVIGSGYLHMAAGCELEKDDQTYNCVVGLKTQRINDVKEWTRFSLVFTTCDEENPDIKKAGIKDEKTTIYFGNSGTNASEYLILCGLKVEKGNTPTDWFPSIDDINNNAEEYTRDFVEENVPKETEAQIQAYDAALKGETVLKKLTDGFKHVGLYTRKLEVNDREMSLLINASYIKSGMLDANIIKTGWIRDTSGKNQWNLETGYFETNQMHANNIVATGMFTTGNPDSYTIQMEKGVINGYRNRQWVGSIDPSASIRNIQTGRTSYGLALRAKGNIDIRTPELSIRDRNDNGVSTTTYTGNISWDMVGSIRDRGNGAIEWVTYTRNIQVINGLIVAASR